MDGVWRDDPWAVDPAAFPPQDSRARLRFLVTYAVLAPSGHNTQPWRFVLRDDATHAPRPGCANHAPRAGGASHTPRACGDSYSPRACGATLDIRADRTRSLPVVDPDGRALVMACGAALQNLVTAAEALGEALRVEHLPDPADHDLLARIHALGPCAPAITGPRMLRAMTARRTSRFAYEPDPLPGPLRAEAIAAAARGDDAALGWFDDAATRHAIALLISEGDRIQMADAAFRHELAAWMRARGGATRDGMSGAAFGMPDMLSFAAALVIRTFDMGAGVAAKDQALAEGSPVLGLLWTPGDSPRDWLAAGRAMQRVLLAVTAAGFTASFMNQPIEVATLRPKLAAAAGVAGVPQSLMRLGRGPKPVPAVRRPVRDVLRDE